MSITLIQVAKGIHGVRQLAAARADIELRKRGLLPPEKLRHGGGRPWTDEEYDEGKAMRLAGRSSKEIAEALDRTEGTINQIIGYATRRAVRA